MQIKAANTTHEKHIIRICETNNPKRNIIYIEVLTDSLFRFNLGN